MNQIILRVEVVESLERVVHDDRDGGFVDVAFETAVDGVHGAAAAEFHADLREQGAVSRCTFSVRGVGRLGRLAKRGW